MSNIEKETLSPQQKGGGVQISVRVSLREQESREGGAQLSVRGIIAHSYLI